jgi:hypothetical protein
MTKYGFYSIVQKEPGVYHIRARERSDLENLIKAARLECKIVDTIDAQTDYPCRIVTDYIVVMQVIEHLGKSLDYPNFKKRVKATHHQINKWHIYYDVWDLLSSALGRYGKPGYLTKGNKNVVGVKG